jgi:hypothetical protein
VSHVYGWLRSSALHPIILLSFISLPRDIRVDMFTIVCPIILSTVLTFLLPGSEMKTLVNRDVASLAVSCLLSVGKVGH